MVLEPQRWRSARTCQVSPVRASDMAAAGPEVGHWLTTDSPDQCAGDAALVRQLAAAHEWAPDYTRALLERLWALRRVPSLARRCRDVPLPLLIAAAACSPLGEGEDFEVAGLLELARKLGQSLGIASGGLQ